MRFFGTTIIKYAVVETDDGMFRVDSDGSLTKHDSETGWRWFDNSKISDTDLNTIKQQGLAALGAQ